MSHASYCGSVLCNMDLLQEIKCILIDWPTFVLELCLAKSGRKIKGFKMISSEEASGNLIQLRKLPTFWQKFETILHVLTAPVSTNKQCASDTEELGDGRVSNFHSGCQFIVVCANDIFSSINLWFAFVFGLELPK